MSLFYRTGCQAGVVFCIHTHSPFADAVEKVAGFEEDLSALIYIFSCCSHAARLLNVDGCGIQPFDCGDAKYVIQKKMA
jgi:hypothetical protein